MKALYYLTNHFNLKKKTHFNLSSLWQNSSTRASGFIIPQISNKSVFSWISINNVKFWTHAHSSANLIITFIVYCCCCFKCRSFQIGIWINLKKSSFVKPLLVITFDDEVCILFSLFLMNCIHQVVRVVNSIKRWPQCTTYIIRIYLMRMYYTMCNNNVHVFHKHNGLRACIRIYMLIDEEFFFPL